MRKSLSAIALAIPLLLAGCVAPSQNDPGYRTSGMVVEDHSLESGIYQQLVRHDARFRDANVRVHSFNGIVLITGQVPSEELRDKVLSVSTQARHARHVHNQLKVSANSRATDRARDTWLATKAKASLAHFKLSNENAVDPSRVRIVVERNEAFLMGIVTRREAAQVTDIVKGVNGITRISRVFDYLD